MLGFPVFAEKFKPKLRLLIVTAGLTKKPTTNGPNAGPRGRNNCIYFAANRPRHTNLNRGTLDSIGDDS
jgi:hypothetical protein